jgi:hypothetical protein
MVIQLKILIVQIIKQCGLLYEKTAYPASKSAHARNKFMHVSELIAITNIMTYITVTCPFSKD